MTYESKEEVNFIVFSEFSLNSLPCSMNFNDVIKLIKFSWEVLS